ncbi:DUF4189 domain-containing protein [Nocardia vinacea]|uniref:DUF4189 domain-containing protein n=1 Tax=Nocardia vinacea TaxID=96468 RepID=A0ABZ1YX60_9NOCA|nr:DUF4189 domain-containing protein [Nocardia vinacea]
MNKLMTAVTVAATGIALAVSAAPAQAQANEYGAIAISRSTSHYGFWYGSGSFAAAESNAVNSCIKYGGGSDCTAKISWRNGCGALAISRNYWSYGSGPSLAAAKNKALANNPGNAYIEHWNCTSGYSL